jgi:hypothetical protein
MVSVTPMDTRVCALPVVMLPNVKATAANMIMKLRIVPMCFILPENKCAARAMRDLLSF